MFRRPLTLAKLAIALSTFFLLLLLSSRNIRHKQQKPQLSALKEAFENPLELLNADFYPKTSDYELQDWHDYEFMRYEASRTGFGENGSRVTLTDPEDVRLNAELFEVEGLSAHVSDLISVNRSLPDVRHELCHRRRYLKNLPSVTIIVIFHNEHLSVIQRTLHSIVNRTPASLLDALILVNDASTKPELYGNLSDYIALNFPPKVTVLDLPERVGLIRARLEGAKAARSEILVFLDSHVEVNVNWLPPLIEPIALNPRACTIPITDLLFYEDFAYEVPARFGTRAIFNWDFDYRWVRRPDYLATMPKPTPIMLGCAFAINRAYFWHLGGYDEELLIWNGENYELSFKLWLCGDGQLLEAPCSRVAHMFRKHNAYRKLDGVDFVARNFKRIAEVWMGEWRRFLYKTNETRFARVDAGDLTKAREVHRRLNCRSFDYFVHWVAPEMTNAFAMPRDEDVAYGALSVSNGSEQLCLSDGKFKHRRCEIAACGVSLVVPHRSEYFHVSASRSLEHDRTEMCLEKRRYARFPHYEYRKNRWNYRLERQQIELEDSGFCLALNFSSRVLQLRACNGSDSGQRWAIGFVNRTLVET